MKKTRVAVEVLLMFTIGFCWYLYLTGEAIFLNWRKEVRRRKMPL